MPWFHPRPSPLRPVRRPGDVVARVPVVEAASAVAGRLSRLRLATIPLTLVSLAAAATVGTVTAPATAAATDGSFVVLARPGQEADASRRATELGLRVTRRLDIVHGFAVQGPVQASARLASTTTVLSVTPDRSVRPMSLPMSGVAPLGYAPADTGSPSAVSRITGAQDAWAAGWTGAGIDVAVIDTGVAPVPGLSAPGQVVTGPDLSLDAPGSPVPGLDAYGHGTFMAGLIAGRDASAHASAAGCTTCLNASGYSDTTTYVGMAPDARIVNVKVGAADGAADVSQVIAAIDWVTQHAHDPGMNIRVLNLSFGTGSSQPYTVDPLAQAAEQAWRHGIVVVAAAGNEGRSASSLADPAYDPFLLAVGGDETNGTLDRADDRVPSFAQHGTLARPVDVIAPATHLLGLRVPGSYVDTLPDNTGQVGSRFQRGSGTSQAAAIVSGLVALLAQKYPAATPDQLKALVLGTAAPLRAPASSPGLLHYRGHGIAQAGAALSQPLQPAPQAGTPSTGLGTLDAARGGVYLVEGGVPLIGQQDIFGRPFSGSAMAAAQARAAAWSGGAWNGVRWTGAGWSGGAWAATTWTGVDWAGVRWTGVRWTGVRWTGTAWEGVRWTGSGWSGVRWTGSVWAGGPWSGAGWS
ncbi:MAG TPA: S8 family serine peptidase [Kineosporiaceae bacterium]|nr:S8 family serine peptidase [Kineosporiaceae bacterium]